MDIKYFLLYFFKRTQEEQMLQKSKFHEERKAIRKKFQKKIERLKSISKKLFLWHTIQFVVEIICVLTPLVLYLLSYYDIWVPHSVAQKLMVLLLYIFLVGIVYWSYKKANQFRKDLYFFH